MSTATVREFCDYHNFYIQNRNVMIMYLEMLADNGYANKIDHGLEEKKYFHVDKAGDEFTGDLTWIVRKTKRDDYIRVDDDLYTQHSINFNLSGDSPLYGSCNHLRTAIINQNSVYNEIREYISAIRKDFSQPGRYFRNNIMVLNNPITDDDYKHVRCRAIEFVIQNTSIELCIEFNSPRKKFVS